MTEDNFLTRWSRRKREADIAKTAPPAEAGPKADAKAAGAPGSDQKAEAEFDPASLPPIESINAISDITAFLRAGVPPELTRAALRRVWTADPAIRDFVGLAENAWDFTDPNAMPGFGPLEATDEVRRMIAQVVDKVGELAKERVPDPTSAQAASLNDSNVIEDNERQALETPAAELAPPKPAETLGNQVLLHRNKEDIAAQNNPSEASEKPKQLSRRSHGGALPE